MSEIEFKPVEFNRVEKYTRLRPPINTSNTGGWIRGQLVSLHYAKKVLLFTMAFFPHEPGLSKQPESAEEPKGWATFLVLRKRSDYFGRIVDGSGIRHGDHQHGEFQRVGTTETFPGHPGRHRAAFLMKSGSVYPQNEVSVFVFMRTRLFGGWKDVIITEPEGMLCIARP